MSGKQSKRERKALTASGVHTTSTRAGRKHLRDQENIVKADAETKRLTLETERFSALTPEQQDAEHSQSAAERKRSLNRVSGMLSALGCLAGSYPIQSIGALSRQPFARRGR